VPPAIGVDAGGDERAVPAGFPTLEDQGVGLVVQAARLAEARASTDFVDHCILPSDSPRCFHFSAMNSHVHKIGIGGAADARMPPPQQTPASLDDKVYGIIPSSSFLAPGGWPCRSW
jgi:hypothetical protein